jgi:hypothetical protein
MEESFNTTVDEIVRRINSVLHQYYSNNTYQNRRGSSAKLIEEALRKKPLHCTISKELR